MKRLSASILAISLAMTAVPAAAQYQHLQPYPDSQGHVSGAQYDYARVIRVDPVIGGGYGRSDARAHCREQPTYVGGDRYDPGYYGQNGYGRDGYARDSYRRDSYGRDGYGRDGYYDRGYSDPYAGRQGGQAGATVATVVGGVVGAVLGSQVGGGSGRYVTSAIGSMVGGMAGREIYDRSRQRDRVGSVRVCDPVPADGRYYPAGDRAVSAYDVTYEYAGRQYTTRTDHHPGDRIRVRVDVRPD
ncbi:glycine zipper 2TM domain-containing protein [Lysobacter korlensis]|uniref:Glycine zipper 2TM domain-containing protein n=1 Tax=Lysobacter korlensis TaxID=553636 RepID=A0ABV6RPE5_9GAMM